MSPEDINPIGALLCGTPLVALGMFALLILFSRYISMWMFGTKDLLRELQTTNAKLTEMSAKVELTTAELKALRRDIHTDNQIDQITTMQQPPQTTPRY